MTITYANLFSLVLSQILKIKAMFDSLNTLRTAAPSGISQLVYNIPVTALTSTTLGVIAFVETGLVGLSWFIYGEIGWQIYRGFFFLSI